MAWARSASDWNAGRPSPASSSGLSAEASRAPCAARWMRVRKSETSAVKLSRTSSIEKLDIGGSFCLSFSGFSVDLEARHALRELGRQLGQLAQRRHRALHALQRRLRNLGDLVDRLAHRRAAFDL